MVAACRPTSVSNRGQRTPHSSFTRNRGSKQERGMTEGRDIKTRTREFRGGGSSCGSQRGLFM